MPILSLNRDRERGAPLPWWLTLLDVLGVVLPLLALNALLIGGFRLRSETLVLSLTSWQRLTFWSVVVLSARHLLVPRPALPQRLAFWRGRPPGSFRLADAVVMGAGTRLALLLLGYLATVVIGGPSDAPTTGGWVSWALPPGCEGWRHIRVAREGYAGAGMDVTVFPALGLLLRGSERALAVPPPVAGLAIAIASFVGAMFYMYRLARIDVGHGAALASIALLAAFPGSLAHSLVSVEPLFLLAAVGAFWHVRRGEWVRASAWGLVLGLTRPGGFLVALPLAVVAGWRPSREAAPRITSLSRALVPAAAPVVGLLIALTYSAGGAGIFGAVPSPRVLETAESLVQVANQGLLPTVSRAPLAVLDALSAVFALAVVWPITRRFGPAYGLFVLVGLLGSVLFGGEATIGRQTAVLFPLFLWMGAAVPAPHRFGWISLFALTQGLAAVLFFTRRGQW